MIHKPFTRRTLLQLLSAGAVTTATWPLASAIAAKATPITKKIPSSGEPLTVIGMGTWQTFNVGNDPVLRKDRTRVLKAFFDRGGEMVDSSPMYGSSQDVLGFALKQLGFPKQLFSADKVWTSDGDATREQVSESVAKWKIKTFDLMQVHNLLSWQAHLDTLEQMKADKQVRYIGITTSHGRRHREFEKVMRNRDLDFVQLSYNMVDREVESRLLPLAREKGIAVIANRPFDGGALVDRVQENGYPLPKWAGEIDCANWPQFLLKFIVSHPAVTCAIPATTKVEHMQENMGAAYGRLPDAKQRQRMLTHLQSL